jgi:hypothetical protein
VDSELKLKQAFLQYQPLLDIDYSGATSQKLPPPSEPPDLWYSVAEYFPAFEKPPPTSCYPAEAISFIQHVEVMAYDTCALPSEPPYQSPHLTYCIPVTPLQQQYIPKQSWTDHVAHQVYSEACSNMEVDDYQLQLAFESECSEGTIELQRYTPKQSWTCADTSQQSELGDSDAEFTADYEDIRLPSAFIKPIDDTLDLSPLGDDIEDPTRWSIDIFAHNNVISHDAVLHGHFNF